MKKIIISIIFILFISGIGKSQNEKVVHFGFNAGVKRTHEIVEETDLVQTENLNGFTFGLDVFYKLNQLLELKSGISYNNIPVQRTDYTPAWGCDFDGNSGFDQYGSWTEDDIIAHFIGIPLELRVKISGNENNVYLKSGMEFLYKAIQKTNSTIVECENRNEYSGNTFGNINNVNYIADFGMGFEFQIQDKLKLYLEPQIEYTLNTVFENASPESNSRILSLEFKIGTRF